MEGIEHDGLKPKHFVLRYRHPYAHTLNLPLPLMNEITMYNFIAIGKRPDASGIASAQNDGKLSVRV